MTYTIHLFQDPFNGDYIAEIDPARIHVRGKDIAGTLVRAREIVRELENDDIKRGVVGEGNTQAEGTGSG